MKNKKLFLGIAAIGCMLIALIAVIVVFILLRSQNASPEVNLKSAFSYLSNNLEDAGDSITIDIRNELVGTFSIDEFADIPELEAQSEIPINQDDEYTIEVNTKTGEVKSDAPLTYGTITSIEDLSKIFHKLDLEDVDFLMENIDNKTESADGETTVTFTSTNELLDYFIEEEKQALLEILRMEDYADSIELEYVQYPDSYTLNFIIDEASGKIKETRTETVGTMVFRISNVPSVEDFASLKSPGLDLETFTMTTEIRAFRSRVTMTYIP